jgi:hypothetical protein
LNDSKSSHFINVSGQQPCSLDVAAVGVAIVFGGGGGIGGGSGGSGGRLLDDDDDDDCGGGKTRFQTSSDEFDDDDDVLDLNPTGDANVSSPSLSDGL